MPTPPVQPPEPSPDWTEAQPEYIPEPTFWPAFLGLGATLLVWGLITSDIITALGLVLFGGSLAGWIGDLRHEREQKQRTDKR